MFQHFLDFRSKQIFSFLLYVCLSASGLLYAQGDLPSPERVAEKMRMVDSLNALPPRATNALPPKIGSSFTPFATSPNSDCGNAIPICQQSYTQTSSYDDYGYIQELSSTCLLANEQKTVWYIFTAQSSGSFGFMINTPYDYDFALFNITGSSCSNISTMTPVRCNFSGTYGQTGIDANNVVGGNISYNASQSPTMPGINVTAGQTYVLVLDNYTRDVTGYTIAFNGTASIFDNTGPTISTATLNCGATSGQILVTFDEPVQCSSLIPANFSIAGGLPASIPVTAISGVGCGSGTFATQAYLSYNPSTILNGGPYTVTATGIKDKCGNTRTSSRSIPFTVPALPTYSGVITCGTNGNLRVTFSQPVWCSSIQLADFSATGGLTLTSATPVNCTGSPTSTTTVDIAFNTPGTSGSYSINLTGTILSAACTPGYTLNTGTVLTFNYLTNPTMSATAPSVCLGVGTNVTFTLAGLPASGASVAWMPSGGTVGGTPFGQTYTVAPATTTTYTATITYGACVKTASYTVTGVAAPVSTVTPQNIAICAANVPIAANATISGGPCAGCTYAWTASPAEGGFPTTGTSITGTPGHTYTVTVTSPAGCVSAPVSTTISSAASPPPIPTCNVLFVSPGGVGTGLAATSPTTLANALSMAGTNNVVIKMTVGVYSLSDFITISCNNELEGGYNGTFTSKTSDMSGGANTTIIRRNTTQDTDVGGGSPRVSAIRFAAGSAGMRLQDIRIEVANAAAGSRVTNYGVYVGSGCSNYKIVRCYITSGIGGSGVNGTNGSGLNASGTPGSGGGGGGGSWTQCGGTGATGTAGGTSSNGGAGGAGGSGCSGGGCNIFGCNANTCRGNTGGTPGMPGTPAQPATAATPGLANPFYNPAGVGATGTGGIHGGGGGGGGGGDIGTCCTCTCGGGGLNGGTGGTGGRGGNPGSGGSGGGGSFPIYIINNGTGAEITDCMFSNVAGSGGSGGVGAGGSGGSSGSAGQNHSRCGDGGGGGTGGWGGTGGTGGTGANGPSGLTCKIALVSGSNVTYKNNGSSSSLGIGANNPADFNLLTQSIITVSGASCTGQNFTHTTAAPSPSWASFGATASPASGTGSPINTQYSGFGRKVITMTTGTPQVCGTWTDNFETAKPWTFTVGGGVANRGAPYLANCSNTCVTGGARSGTNVINLANCGNYATTYASITLTLCSAGVFSGYYKIGSESSYDLFNYAIDAIPVRGTNTIASGCNNTWTAFNINVPVGTHTIYLGYCTDVSITANGGKVWLDDVQCTNVELSPATFVSNTYTDFNNVIVSVPPLPTITASAVNSCPGTLSFTTTVGVTPGYTFLWSAPAVSGQTPTISSTTSPSPTITFPNATASPITFTVNCQITTPCCGVLGTATKTITINPVPVVPTAANVATCTGGSATLTATAPSGVTFTWYNVPSGGSALAVGPTYNIASCPSGVTNYYVEAENAQGCQSARTLVTLTGTALSTPTAGAFTTPCVGGSTTLSVTCPACPIGTIFSWWNAPTGGTTYGNGSSIATVAINTPTTYYAEAESPNGCHSARTPIIINPGAVTPPTATPFARCGSGQVDLSVNPIAGATSYNWYNVSMGGVALQSNLSLQFSPTIATTTTYYVSVTLAGCSESARTSVTGTILPPQATVYWTGNASNSWFNPNNWYPVGCLPDCGINADIQANRPPAAGGGACPNQPTIPSYPTHAECQNITIGTGATLTFGAPDAYLGVCGNWSQAGTVTMTQGTVEFQGIVGNQNYTRTGAGNLYNVIINNTSGAATITLNNDMVLSNGGTLVFSSGRIVTGANEVYVMNGSLAAILGHGINSYVQGNLRREITQIGAYEFPVGLAPASKGYQRAIIDFSNIGSIRRLRAFFILHPILPSALNIAECGTTFNCDPFDNGKWVIDAFNAGGASISGSDAIYSPTLYPRTVTNYCPGAAGYTVMKQPTGAGNSWNMYGTCDPTSTSARITRLNITNGFSEFGVEQSTTPLPVDFLSLTANPINNQYIAVKWITEKEFENVGFELERSLDGHQYQKITWVDGNGTSQVQHTYGYDDKNVNANNLYYYRLKQIDSNGGFRYSNVVSAMINSNELGIQLYPNPTSGQINIDFFTPEDDILQAKVINVLGQEVLKKQFTAKKGPQTFILDISGIAEGTYTVVLSNSTKTITQKVVKTK